MTASWQIFLLASMYQARQQSPPELFQVCFYERPGMLAGLENMVKIGNGGSAMVYRAVWLGVRVAVKTFHGPENPYFKKEVTVFARLRHPNIAPLFSYGADSGECSIVMELMDEDLQSLLRTRLRERRFPFCIFVMLDRILQIAKGMRYLHQMRIVHRDLKSQNILVRCAKSADAEKEGFVRAKVADFGLSRTKERSRTCSIQTPHMGTTRWMSPEMVKQESDGRNEKYPFHCDVYSFAMVCYEVLTGEIPFLECYKPF